MFKEPQRLTKHAIRAGGQLVGDLFVKPSVVRPPRWLSLFSEAIDISSLGIRTASAQAVLLVRRGQRIVALAFGHGRHLLKPGSFEENFGLLATLNSVDQDRVRQIDRKRFDAISRLTREQALRAVPIVDFGLELEQDLLRSLTGAPTDLALGKRLSGRDALSASVAVDLRGLPERLDAYLKKGRGRAYRERFPWVDNIDEVRDDAKREELDGSLLERIRKQDLDRAWLVVPDLLDWTDVEGFRYSRGARAEVHADIHFATYLEQLRQPEALSVAVLKRHHVLCVSASTDNVIQEWPVYRCIYAELDTSEGTFLLDNGKWYRVDRDLVTRVDREIKRIGATGIELPAYEAGETEENYNRRFAGKYPLTHALMDRKLIRYGGGRSQIEFCDVFTKSHVMVHVKRYGGSSVLSHLFSQGVASASLLLWDDGFRRSLNQRLPLAHRVANPAARPNPAKYEVAFAIASQSENQLVLPFFSRVTLRNAYRQLSNYGFKVSCSKISVAG